MSKRSTAFALDLTAAADLVKVTQTRRVERGSLVTLFATPFEDTGRYGDTFLNAYIRTGGSERVHGSVCLISDYVYGAHCASWHGNYPILPDSTLVIEAQSRIATIIRISGTIDVEE